MGYKARLQANKGQFMRSDSNGNVPAVPAVVRTGLLSLALLVGLGLSACTTTEGTNAMTDFGTFEREVMTSTLEGFGVVDREEKEEINQRRAPLVMPKTASLPAPTPADRSTVAMLPEDSDNVQLDTSNLSEADIKRLRNARVVDLRTLSGRPLTDTEAKQLTARMTATQLKSGPRPLYLPPDEYFTTVRGQDMVCLAPNGDLVPLNDKACPDEIRRALRRAAPQGAGGTDPTAKLSDQLKN